MSKRKGGNVASREEREAWARESLRVTPHVPGPVSGTAGPGMTCGRCGAENCVIVPNVGPDFKTLQGVGLTQHTMLCPEVCAGPWWCGLCAGENFQYHADNCEVAHPEVRAEWEKKTDHQMMKLAAMVAARGEFLPAFLMDMLFPGFPHADPPSFAAFKQANAEVRS